MLTGATPDPRPRARIKDSEQLRTLHLVWMECALCSAVEPRSLHHISKHPRDDVRENLVMLCGSGTTGCHGLIEAEDERTISALGQHLLERRSDSIRYLLETRGEEWLRQRLLIHSPAVYSF